VTAPDAIDLTVGALQGIGASTVFILVLFIGFCILVGFTKLKATAGGDAVVIKSLDERITKRPMVYLGPNAPRGQADQLRGPGLTPKV
jgi:hypothetical protein